MSDEYSRRMIQEVKARPILWNRPMAGDSFEKFKLANKSHRDKAWVEVANKMKASGKYSIVSSSTLNGFFIKCISNIFQFM